MCLAVTHNYANITMSLSLLLYRISPQAEQQDIFSKWHVCYHGTNPTHICEIIQCGRLLKPGILTSIITLSVWLFSSTNPGVMCCTGDRAPDGRLRAPGQGRWNEQTAPRGHNVNQYFFSPTPLYSELYATQNE